MAETTKPAAVQITGNKISNYAIRFLRETSCILIEKSKFFFKKFTLSVFCRDIYSYNIYCN
jgi:hypothetical protein